MNGRELHVVTRARHRVRQLDGAIGHPMIRFEQTFADFLLHHQEQHNRTYHFLILMDALDQRRQADPALLPHRRLAGQSGPGRQRQRPGRKRHAHGPDRPGNHHPLPAGLRPGDPRRERRIEGDHPAESRRAVLRLFRPAGRLVEHPPRPARRLHVRHRQAEPGRARGRPPAGGQGLHRRRNVRHPHRHLHPRAEGRRHLAVPDRRDDDLRQADAGDPAPRTPDLGAVVQRGQPPRLRPAGSAVDRRRTRAATPSATSGRWRAISTA